jgi:hypothetical protein
MRNVAVVSHRELAESITNLVKAPDSQTQTRTYYRRSDALSGWKSTWFDEGQNDSRPILSDGPAVTDLTGADLLAGPCRTRFG